MSGIEKEGLTSAECDLYKNLQQKSLGCDSIILQSWRLVATDSIPTEKYNAPLRDQEKML